MQNPGIIGTVYSGIFRDIHTFSDIQEYSSMFRHFEWQTVRYIEAYLGDIKAYGGIIRYIRNSG